MRKISSDLVGGWRVQVGAQAGKGEALEIPAKVPGTFLAALAEAGQLPSPNTVAGIKAAAAYQETPCVYRLSFDAAEELLAAPSLRLVFEGLDTVCSVELNGEPLLACDNMFLSLEADVKGRLRPTDNQLVLRFEPALTVAHQRQAEHGIRPVWNGDFSRVYLRKAQYQFGWDFGPTLLGAGPWRPVRLLAYESRLVEVEAPVELAADLKSARVQVKAVIDGASEKGLQAALRLLAPDGSVAAEATVPVKGGLAQAGLEVAAPRLWWPNGYGEQPLYRLELELRRGKQTLDATDLRLGFRRLRLIEKPLHEGATFYFEVNGRPIFCGGANWIPCDLNPSRVSEARYRVLLGDAKNAGMSMLRIWGGGIYESPLFYDLCDELGLLIFQDFLFACGLYPAHERFKESVATEAAAAIRSLRHHACLAIWSGNNEDYCIAQSLNAYKGPTEPIPPPPAAFNDLPRFDGRALYEQVLPAACAAGDPGRSYWPGSPYSREHADPQAASEGDRHIWDVWHGKKLDYQEYATLIGRFASEFGMEGLPDRAVLARCLGEQLSLETLPLANHATDGTERIAHYVSRNLKQPTTLDEYIYATQLVQAEAMAYAVRAFRRKFGGKNGIECGGALLWQLDDCWPGISWSIIGYCDEGDAVAPRKPSYYSVRRELQMNCIGLERGASPSTIDAWIVVQSAEVVRATVKLSGYTCSGQKVFAVERSLLLPPDQATEIGSFALPEGEAVVVGAELHLAGKLVARSVLWPQPLRSLPLADPGLVVERQGDTLRLSVQRPAKGVLLSSDRPLAFSDNLIDLLPGEVVEVSAPGLGAGPLEARSLYSVLR